MARITGFKAACFITCLIGPVLAHAAVPPDVEELERAHQADEDERRPIPERPRPPFVTEERLHAAPNLWRCRGTEAWQKVYAKPDLSSSVIGLTQPEVAVSGDPVNGFLAMLFYNGHLGYLPAASVHAFRQPNNPGTTCTFAGLTDRGMPRFRFDHF